MAAALEFGNALEPPAHMHPFFRASANKPNGQPQSLPTARRGPDGVYENGCAIQEASNVNITTDGGTNLGDEMLQVLSAQREDCGEPSWSIAEGDDLESEHTRVKRRKVSDETPQILFGSVTDTGPSESTWHGQLQDAANILLGPEEAARFENTTSELTKTAREHFSQSMQSPLRSTSQPYPPFTSSFVPAEIDSSQSSDRLFQQLDGPMDDPPLKRTKPSSTPRKPALRNDHGKLSFSPKSPPRQSPRSGGTKPKTENKRGKTTNQPSKKVEMKNGKLVSSLRVVLPYSAPDSAARIDEILSGRSHHDRKAPLSQPVAPSKNSTTTKATHPFFLSKPALKEHKLQPDPKSETSTSAPATSEDETCLKLSQTPAKAWKDIVFGSGKALRQATAALPSIWPPSFLQHIRPLHDQRALPATQRLTSREWHKLKQPALSVRPDEDILQSFSDSLKHEAGKIDLHLPRRSVMSGKGLVQMLDLVPNAPSEHVSRLKARIETTPSSFDKGMAAGSQIWYHEYAPTCWQDLLGTQQSEILHDWLSSLQVHQVQSGKLQKSKSPILKKQRRKRKSGELDDFIAESDDDDSRSGPNGKTAILLIGPPGTGKTASVYAVAQQLGFEVFELHPGARRSAKDIQDKVGDMTRNHLVQQSKSLSRESSVSTDDRAVLTHNGPLSATQTTISSFANTRRGKQPKLRDTIESKRLVVKSQKQSLILLEEVDILFDEDKGFWSCVQWLIKTSKRPVILTCNDLDSIPVDELDLFTVLQYGRPGPDIAVQHLSLMAAAEGHLLSKEALCNLYLTKGQDLRASVTELNLWCQMTVGSQQGGLDWMLPHDGKRLSSVAGSVTRIVSQDTYITGLDLLPVQFEDDEDLIRFAQDNLGISPLKWVKNDICWSNDMETRLQSLDRLVALADARSAMDMFSETAAPILAATIWKISTPAFNLQSSSREEVVRLFLENLDSKSLHTSTISSAFEPLLDESRIGLPTVLGRKAPTLDNVSSTSIVTEVAPYIRSIVSHDKRLEQVWTELHGSSQNGNGPNKRQRKTRAARAAMEGGSKDTTRREKWFPEDLNWAAVLKTGGDWPMAQEDETGTEMASRAVSMEQTPTPASTPSIRTETETGLEV